jgi:hypothetical protein
MFASPTTVTHGAKSIRQVCADYNLSRSTVYHLARIGQLKLSKIGAKTVLLAADEAAFVEMLRAEPFEPARVGRRRSEAA